MPHNIFKTVFVVMYHISETIKSSVIRQKDESQNGSFKKANDAQITEK